MPPRMPVHFAMLILLFVAGCSPGHRLPFIPASELIEEGVVNKYYYSYSPFEGIDEYADIEYRAYFLLDRETIVQDIYDPGFRLKSRQVFEMNDSSLHLQEESVFMNHTWTLDTLRSEILLDEYFSLKVDSPLYQTIQRYASGHIRHTNTFQSAVHDTIVDGKKAILIQRQFNLLIETPEGDSNRYEIPSTQLYVDGLGLYHLEGNRPEGTAELLLMEQFSMEEFEMMKARKPERVAFINPKSTLDYPTDFETCLDQQFANDYYNGDPDAGYTGGKQALLQDILAQLNPETLGNESGYLTFRFVVNCEGRAGWFTTEQATLDYLPTQFPPALIEHLFTILRSLDQWHPTVIRDEKRDAYCYLTFKLNHGQLIDLLP